MGTPPVIDVSWEYTFLGSMCHLQVRIVDDPVSKIVRKLYLRCLSCTWIFFSVKHRHEPGQTSCENREIQQRHTERDTETHTETEGDTERETEIQRERESVGKRVRGGGSDQHITTTGRRARVCCPILKDTTLQELSMSNVTFTHCLHCYLLNH